MESAGCPGSTVQEKEDRSQSEGSCSECSCEACRNGDSAEDNGEHQELNFTKMKDTARSNFPTAFVEDPLPVFQSLSPHAENLTVAIEDLHARQAKLKGKKQRRCSFCKIHGFPINIKGHKAFCQFRENCMCKGCTLIRCNQQVSKNQVRLRRQKDMEVDFVGMATGSVDHTHLDTPDPLKKSPMCFKCWVHDSVRVRLKGHRNICPYTRCACSNCALNADRKRLTRELRQLIGTMKNKESREGGREMNSNSFACLRIPSPLQGFATTEHQQNVSMLLSNATTAGGLEQYCESGLGSAPVKTNKAGDWHISTMLSTVPPILDAKQESAHFQSIVTGIPCHRNSFPLDGPVPAQEHNNLMPMSKWLPDFSFTPSSCTSTVPKSHGAMSHVTTTISSDCRNGVNFATADSSRAGQGNNVFGFFPQHTVFKSNEAAGAMMQASGGYTTYPFCPPYHFLPQHCQQAGQNEHKVNTHTKI